MKKLLLTIFLIFLIQNPVFAIKIGLQTGVISAKVGASTEAQILDARNNKVLYTMDKMRSYEFKAYKNLIALKYNNDYYNLKTNQIAIIPTSPTGFVNAKNRWYRGELRIINLNGKLNVINKLNIEDYIRGVVPCEMPSSWNYEAHKAQAIAARSYALANLGKRGSQGYDLKDTPEDQAYGGATSEKLNTNRAVKDSEGIVIIYDLKIIPAYYSASAGGHTKNASEVWTRDLPYIKSVPSYDSGIKKNGHGIGMSQHGANNLANNGYNSYQILRYFYKNIKFARIKQDYYK